MNEQVRCQHSVSQIRWRTLSNGARQAWRQCLMCYQTVGTALKHADAPKDAPEFDEDAREAHWQQIGQVWQEQQRQRDAEFETRRSERRQEYLDYLQTVAWKRKREAVLERANYVCQAQMQGCFGRASQAHHLTYEHVFDEPLFDLVAVCRNCHERLHSDFT